MLPSQPNPNPTINQYDAFQFDAFQFDSFQMDGGQNYATKYGNRARKKIPLNIDDDKQRIKKLRNLLILLASLEDEL